MSKLETPARSLCTWLSLLVTTAALLALIAAPLWLDASSDAQLLSSGPSSTWTRGLLGWWNNQPAATIPEPGPLRQVFVAGVTAAILGLALALAGLLREERVAAVTVVAVYAALALGLVHFWLGIAVATGASLIPAYASSGKASG